MKWIGVGFDGTLAHAPAHSSWPVPPAVTITVDRVRKWLAGGMDVRIFTARICPLNRCVLPWEKRELHGTWIDNNREDSAWESIEAIRAFCARHFDGHVLPITNVADGDMSTLWDWNVVQVLPNYGVTEAEDAQDRHDLPGDEA